MDISIILFYIFLAFITIKAKQTYTPAGIMVLLWAALNCSLFIFFRDLVEFMSSGIFYIILCVAVFMGGAIVGKKTTQQKDDNQLLHFNRKCIVPLLLLLIALGCLYPLYRIYENGFSLTNLFKIDELNNMTREMYIKQYFNEKQDGNSKFAQVLLVFSYTAPLFGGFCWPVSKTKITKVLCILTIIPCLLITASQSTKMTLISALILWISGFLTCSLSYNIKIRISIKTFFILVSVTILFISAMFCSLLTRWNNDYDDYQVEKNKTTFFVYTYGSLVCFDRWFEYSIQNYSTALLQSSRLYKLGYFHNVENGIRADFKRPTHAPSMEIYGQFFQECNYNKHQDYTVSFDVTSDVKPDSAKYAIVSFNNRYISHYPITIDNCEQTGPQTWRYSLTFNLDSSRNYVRTPDIILSYDSVTYVEISNLRIDTGKVAQPWTEGECNIFWHNANEHKYGIMTFFGIANALGIEERIAGIYRDFIYFGRIDRTISSNVYTIFRMLIDDFGKIGALIFLFLLGFASSKAIVFIKKRKMIFISQTILVAVYSYVMWGFVASIWAYTSILCTYGLAFIIFSILQKPLHGETWVTIIAKKLKPKHKFLNK